VVASPTNATRKRKAVAYFIGSPELYNENILKGEEGSNARRIEKREECREKRGPQRCTRNKGGCARLRTRPDSDDLLVDLHEGVLLITDPQRFSMLENKGAVPRPDAPAASAMDSMKAFWFVRNASRSPWCWHVSLRKNICRKNAHPQTPA
jgi:hypothetical protein